MPHADPTKSLEAASRHLFRHLSDLSELQRNPLVQFAFEGRLEGFRDHEPLAIIRTKVLQCGRLCFAEDLESGRKLQAQRGSAILEGLCSGRSIDQLSIDLAITARQVYRERRRICIRVARLLDKFRASRIQTARIFDPFEQFMKRVALLVRSGYSQKAVTELEKALSHPCAGKAGVSILLGLSRANLALGDLCKAQDFSEAAGSALETLVADADYERLSTRLALATFQAAFRKGDYPLMATCAHRLSAWISRNGQAPDTLTIESLVELSHLQFYRANRPEARKLLSQATKLEQRTERVDPALRSLIASELALLDEDCELSSSERLQRLLATFDLNDAAQSVGDLLQTSVLLTRHWQEFGEDDLARDHAIHALQIARTVEGSYLATLTALNVADALLRTRHWHEVGAILDSVRGHISDIPGQTALRVHDAILLRRLGRTNESLKELTSAEATVREWNTNRFIAAVLHEKAIALHQVGRETEAQDCIREAIVLAETCAGPTFLKRTYKVGSMILRQPRLLSLAGQMATRILRGASRFSS